MNPGYPVPDGRSARAGQEVVGDAEADPNTYCCKCNSRSHWTRECRTSKEEVAAFRDTLYPPGSLKLAERDSKKLTKWYLKREARVEQDRLAAEAKEERLRRFAQRNAEFAVQMNMQLRELQNSVAVLQANAAKAESEPKKESGGMAELPEDSAPVEVGSPGLVESKKYSCIFKRCAEKYGELDAMVEHLVKEHKLPLLEMSSEVLIDLNYLSVNPGIWLILGSHGLYLLLGVVDTSGLSLNLFLVHGEKPPLYNKYTLGATTHNQQQRLRRYVAFVWASSITSRYATDGKMNVIISVELMGDDDEPDLDSRKQDAPTCYNCLKLGHTARECLEGGRGQSQTCCNCGEQGHISRDCPNPKNERIDDGGGSD